MWKALRSESQNRFRNRRRFFCKVQTTTCCFARVAGDREMTYPTCEKELVLHKHKIVEVKGFLQRPTSRLLILQGPSGSGKTTCLQCLANDLGIFVVEWSNPSLPDPTRPVLRTFAEFMHRSARYHSVMSERNEGQLDGRTEGRNLFSGVRRIVLVKDLPYLGNPRIRQDFLDIVERFCQAASADCCCCLVVNNTEYSLVNALSAAGRHSPAIISFNPVAKTFLVKILQSQCEQLGLRVDKVSLDLLAADADGDIRQALYQLTIATRGLSMPEKTAQTLDNSNTGVKRKRTRGNAALTLIKLPYVTQACAKDAELDLLHSIGRLMHNKRSGESEASSNAALAEELLPKHLVESNKGRPASNYDIEQMIAGRLSDDTGLSLLYINQNMPNFTEEVEVLHECLDWISEADVLASSAYGRSVMGVMGGGGGGEGATVMDPRRQITLEKYCLSIACRGVLFANVGGSARKSAGPGFQPIRKPIFFSALLQLRQCKQQLDRLSNYFAAFYPGCIGGSRQFKWNMEVLPFLYQMSVRNHPFFLQVPSSLKHDLQGSRGKLQSARNGRLFWDDKVSELDLENADLQQFGVSESAGPEYARLIANNDNNNDDSLWFIGQDDICDSDAD